MRKIFVLGMAVITIAFASCEKMVNESDLTDEAKKRITFNVKGNFKPLQTRVGATQISSSAMTDVWVFDYVDGKLVQQVHQGDKTASNFGSPTLSLSLGNHELYFVCSAGGSPILNVEAHKISWDIPRDTFWKKLTKKITSRTAEKSSLMLDRIATRLSVNIEDALPSHIAKVEIDPTKWYYGLDYLTGNGTEEKNSTLTITIPVEYIGCTNTNVHIFGLSQATEFVTNATITAKDASGATITTQTINNAPMQRNRSTDYTGTMFTSDQSTELSLNTDWDTPWMGTW